MPITADLAALFERDLGRVIQQLEAFSEAEAVWTCPPGVVNSAGNLMLHLEGNLREFVCRVLGGIPYSRVRDQEFAAKDIPVAEMAARLEEVRRLVPGVIAGLSAEALASRFPGDPLGAPIVTERFLIHLYGHLSFHLGQIDYARRILAGSRG